MISSVREIRGLTDEQGLLEHEAQFDTDIREALLPLIKMLDMNIMPLDQRSLQEHMIGVERWRCRVVRLLTLSTAFMQHVKGEGFRKPKAAGITEAVQDAHRRHLSAGFEALCVLLEGFISCIDSRVNICKKLAGIEGEGFKSGRNIPNAA